MIENSRSSRDLSNNFEVDGYLIARNFFDTKLVHDAFDELVKDHDKVLEKLLSMVDSGLLDRTDLAIEDGRLKYLKNANVYFDSVKLLVDSSLNELVASLIGDNVFVDTIELHQKYAGTSETPPHQDNFYFCLENAKSLTAYIPLNRQSKENGGLAVVPKTHKIDFEHYPSDTIGFSSGVRLTKKQEDNIYHYSLNVGDLSLHHCNIVHLAPKNNTCVPRVNIAIRYRSVTEKECDSKVARYKSFLAKSARVSS